MGRGRAPGDRQGVRQGSRGPPAWRSSAPPQRHGRPESRPLKGCVSAQCAFRVSLGNATETCCVTAQDEKKQIHNKTNSHSGGNHIDPNPDTKGQTSAPRTWAPAASWLALAALHSATVGNSAAPCSSLLQGRGGDGKPARRAGRRRDRLGKRGFAYYRIVRHVSSRPPRTDRREMAIEETGGRRGGSARCGVGNKLVLVHSGPS